MTQHDDLSECLAESVRLRQSSKVRRALSIGRRLAAIQVARRSGRQVAVDAETFWGDRMRVVLPEPLSCAVYGYGFFEEGLSTFMLDAVRPGQCVYDVGAHYGYFSRLASQLVGPTGTVHSFEPTPSSFAMLASNTAGLQNVRCHNSAVWHKRELVSFQDFGPRMSMFNSLMAPRVAGSGNPAAVLLEVEALPLDDHAARWGAPDFVKIDAESAEWNIVQGMATILRVHRPVVTVEVGDYGIAGAARSRALLEHVISYGYTAFDYRGGRVVHHTLRDSYEYDNILLVAA